MKENDYSNYNEHSRSFFLIKLLFFSFSINNKIINKQARSSNNNTDEWFITKEKNIFCYIGCQQTVAVSQDSKKKRMFLFIRGTVLIQRNLNRHHVLHVLNRGLSLKQKHYMVYHH